MRLSDRVKPILKNSMGTSPTHTKFTFVAARIRTNAEYFTLLKL